MVDFVCRMLSLSHLLLAFTLILPVAHTIDADLDAALDSGAMAKKMGETGQGRCGER